MVWRRRQQVRDEVTGKLDPVEFELKQANCRLMKRLYRWLKKRPQRLHFRIQSLFRATTVTPRTRPEIGKHLR